MWVKTFICSLLRELCKLNLIEVVDKILLNFQRTVGLFSSILWTKIFTVVFGEANF